MLHAARQAAHTRLPAAIRMHARRSLAEKTCASHQRPRLRQCAMDREHQNRRCPQGASPRAIAIHTDTPTQGRPPAATNRSRHPRKSTFRSLYCLWLPAIKGASFGAQPSRALSIAPPFTLGKYTAPISLIYSPGNNTQGEKNEQHRACNMRNSISSHRKQP